MLVLRDRHLCCRGKAKGALPQDAVQALDVALKNGASNHPECVTLPRAFFFYDPAVVKPVGGGAEVPFLDLHPFQPCQHADYQAWVTIYVQSTELRGVLVKW